MSDGGVALDSETSPPHQLKNVHDLSKSKKIIDKLYYMAFSSMVESVFCRQEDLLCVNLNLETDTNHDLFLSNWEMLEKLFETPPRLKKNKKLVRQALIHMINYLNKRYQFKNPIIVECYSNTISSKNKKVNYSNIKL